MITSSVLQTPCVFVSHLRKLFPFFLLLRGNGICYGSKYFITAIVKATTVEPTSFTVVMHLLFLSKTKNLPNISWVHEGRCQFLYSKKRIQKLLLTTYFMYSRKFRVLEMKIEEKVFFTLYNWRKSKLESR